MNVRAKELMNFFFFFFKLVRFHRTHFHVFCYLFWFVIPNWLLLLCSKLHRSWRFTSLLVGLITGLIVTLVSDDQNIFFTSFN